MQILRIDWPKIEGKDWIKYRFDFVKEYGLNSNDMIVYGYIYRHCSDYSKAETTDKWLGESDKVIAENTVLTERTVSRSIKTLRDKKLILVEKSGTILRRITLNDGVFLKEVQIDMDKVENDMKDIEITKLRKRIEELEDKSKHDYTVFVMPLLKNGIIKQEDWEKVHDYIGPLYYSYAIKEPWGDMASLEAHIRYLKTYKEGTIENPIQYLEAALKSYRYKRRKQLGYLNEYEKKEQNQAKEQGVLYDWLNDTNDDEGY